MTPFGISVALLTPFTSTGEIDLPALAQHARDLVRRGAHGVTLFGTTGEGASISRAERSLGIKALIEGGIPARKITLGVCASALGDAILQVREGAAHGIQTFLLLPPFYFKGCSDEGLFDWHMQLVRATPAETKLILYHIPQVSGVPLSVALVTRLAQTAPDRFVAVKDSAGQWEHTQALLAAGDAQVLVGDERHLSAALRLGGGGSICGTANLEVERLVTLFETQADDPELAQWVGEIVAHPVVPALKALMARRHGQAGWARPRAPLEPLSAEAAATLRPLPRRIDLATEAAVRQG